MTVDHSRLSPAEPASATPPLRISFTGSGSEYFRIWIVNLLLSLLTLGLYLPFAKARRLSYFYSNTLVDGQALAFHGNPWKMLRGFVLLLVLLAVYGVAGRLSPVSGLIAFAVLACIWPALWRASLQFRLGNTSWRGLRFAFKADLAGAYKTVLPVYLPVLVMLAVPVFYADAAQQQHGAQLNAQQAWLIFAPIIVLYLMFPWALALTKRYQHGGYAYADQQTALTASTWRFYTLALKCFGLLLLAMLATALLGLLFALLVGAHSVTERMPPAVMIAAIGLSYLLFFALLAPFFTARMQNLVWNGTHSPALRFESRLRFRPLAWLTLKNWLLTALTLSLYRPFAAVNTARMRLAAMSVQVDGDLDSWLAQLSAEPQDASGDAAGDFFGIDMGL